MQGRFRLALLPGDANPDPILQQRSTIAPEDWAKLHALFTAGAYLFGMAAAWFWGVP